MDSIVSDIKESQEEVDDEPESNEVFSSKDGKSFCDNLFTYLQSLDNVPDNFFSNINEMSAFIEKTSINSMKQSKITDLFAKKC